MGLGVWQMKPPVCKSAVLKAIEFGYRLIDTAQMYFNEQAVGEALAEKTIDRNEMIIATKISPTNYFSKKLKASAEISRQKLQIDSIDLLYLHWPIPMLYRPKTTIKLLSELQDECVTKFVGVSNLSPKQIDVAQAITEHKIVANQVQIHPLFQQKPMQKYCIEHDVH